MADPTSDKQQDARTIDPTTLKALAHPLRIELFELLLDHGPDTASGLGRRVGESSGTTSYHLRRLAAVGLIEEASDIGTGRDRHWQAVRGWVMERDLIEASATRADARMVVDELTDRNIRYLRRWQAEAQLWPHRWSEEAVLSFNRLTLTPEQMGDLGRDLSAVVDRYRRQQQDLDDPGVTRVVAQVNVFPYGEPPPDS